MRSMFMPLRRYARFSGRARRREFWLWMLFLAGVFGACAVVDSNFGAAAVRRGQSSSRLWGDVAAMVGLIFWLATFLPSLAITVRRLHDTNSRGWWLLLLWGPVLLCVVLSILDRGFGWDVGPVGGIAILAVLAGAIAILFWCLVPSERGDNRFGDDPHGSTLEELAGTFE
jgi:uncharacterized membrane protein YhaH (DUF805 family)